MSVNVYLNTGLLRDAGFKNEERDNRVGSKYQHIEWAGIRLSHIDANKRPVYIMASLTDELPMLLETDGMVVMVTVKESFTGDFCRRIGVYTIPNHHPGQKPGWKGTATLDLNPTTRNYELEIKAPTLDAARALYHGIRTGKLVPFEPWDESINDDPKPCTTAIENEGGYTFGELPAGRYRVTFQSKILTHLSARLEIQPRSGSLRVRFIEGCPIKSKAGLIEKDKWSLLTPTGPDQLIADLLNDQLQFDR